MRSFIAVFAAAFALLADTMIGMMREIGIKLVAQPTQGQGQQDILDSCKWDAMLQRGDRQFTVPLAQLQDLAPISTKVPQWHQGTGDKKQDKGERNNASVPSPLAGEGGGGG